MCPLALSPAQINLTPIGKASAIRKQPRIARIQNPCYDGTCHDRGEVTERLKVLASKASVRETVPWVRIPPSPPLLFYPRSKPFRKSGAAKSPGLPEVIRLTSGLANEKLNLFPRCDR